MCCHLRVFQYIFKNQIIYVHICIFTGQPGPRGDNGAAGNPGKAL